MTALQSQERGDGLLSSSLVSPSMPSAGTAARDLRATDPDMKELSNIEVDVLQRTSGRGVRLRWLLDFVSLLLDDQDQARTDIAWLEKLNMRGQRFVFNPKTSTTQDVTYMAIVPMTSARGLALASIINEEQPCYPSTIISHTWQNVFIHTIAAAVAFAQRKHALTDIARYDCYFHVVPCLQSYNRVRQLMRQLSNEVFDSTFWFCPVSVNQHSVICEYIISPLSGTVAENDDNFLAERLEMPGNRIRKQYNCPCGIDKLNQGPGSEVNGFHLMMKVLKHINKDFSQLVAVDKSATNWVELSNAAPHEVPVGICIDWLGRVVSVQKTAGFVCCARRQTPFGKWLVDKHTWKPDIRVGDRVVAIDGHPISGQEGSELSEDTPGRVIFRHCRRRLRMRVIKCKAGKTLKLVVVRQASVFTRAWVVAEVHEAHSQEINQHVCVHYPLSLSDGGLGTVQRLNVMKCEATSREDKDLIIARIGSKRNQREYDSRVKDILSRMLATRYQRVGLGSNPFSFTDLLISCPFGVICISLFMLWVCWSCGFGVVPRWLWYIVFFALLLFAPLLVGSICAVLLAETSLGWTEARYRVVRCELQANLDQRRGILAEVGEYINADKGLWYIRGAFLRHHFGIPPIALSRGRRCLESPCVRFSLICACGGFIVFVAFYVIIRHLCDFLSVIFIAFEVLFVVPVMSLIVYWDCHDKNVDR